MNISQIAFGNVRKNYNYMIKQNDAPVPQQACESIFIYTSEPVEAISFKGNRYREAKFVLPLVMATGSFAASFLKRLHTKSEYKEDIRKIIQNRSDIEYIAALKNGLVPYSDFDRTVLENYNINIDRLEAENRELISKNVDRILKQKKYKKLPIDYPDRIKKAIETQAASFGDKFEITEETVDALVSDLQKNDEEQTKI